MAELPVSAPSALSGASDEKARAKARVGKTVNNKWRIDSLLGVGGMASVYAATHRNGSRAALKILHAEFGRDQNIRERFLREGYVANKVEHRGRVAILDDDVTEQDEPFLVMELLEGDTVHQLWKRLNRRIPVAESLAIAEQVLDTLQAFHSQGIVHRDLKPANIFVTKEDVVKLLDFGVARIREAGTDMTRAGTALGTPSFMAPEQAMGLTNGVDGRADLFSVGATLYAIMSGQRLHQGRSDNEAFILAATTPAPSLARVAPDLPVEVIALVDKALAWDPNNRFPDANAMREEVQRILGISEAPKRIESRSLRRPSGATAEETSTARSEQAEPSIAEPPSQADDPAVLRLVDWFRRIERLLPAVRQYGWNHPEADHKLRGTFQGLIETLRAGPDQVYWSLRPYSFMHRGQTVWEPSQPLDVVPYNLFAAGIREMRIAVGVTEEELRSLFEVMLIDPVRGLTPEDNIATALWEKRLAHVSYEAINAFAEGDASDRETFYEEADRVEELAVRAAEERANYAEAAAMAVKTDEGALIAARQAAAVLGLDPVAKKALGAQLQMSPERWSERFIDVMAAAFLDARRRGDLPLLMQPLDASTRDQILARRFDLLFSMHGAMLRALDVGAGREAPAVRTEYSEGMCSPETLRMLLREVIRPVGGGAPATPGAPDDTDVVAEGLANLLPELGPAYLEIVMDSIATIQNDAIKKPMLAYVERSMPGREMAVIDRLMIYEIETARPLLVLLSAQKTPTANEALRRLAGCANPQLRCEAMALASDNPDQLKDQLVELTEHPQPEIRRAAIRTLSQHRLRSVGPHLVRKIQDSSFQQVAVDERREILAALHVLHPARAESLAIEIVQKHGLLADEPLDVTRTLCVELLGRESKSMQSLEAALAAAKRRPWNTAQLREAATAAAEAIAGRLGKRITASGEIQ